MANIHFQQKIASDELRDTIFFATGTRSTKEKAKEFLTLRAPNLEVKIANFKNIVVNGDKCRSVYEAKLVIMDEML